ncbi:hypothetical protein BIW11_02863 [Tropilaelaps mercedesae]|uniref:Uncharacterized protein n=1 Tax=Tropilaelaps mercedesae TaxID=418985 RepID=A0A1V9XW45_9ACAR|nr:hypothetical protein BIW11_02863 [Tropilaelaps mercedesae]
MRGKTPHMQTNFFDHSHMIRGREFHHFLVFLYQQNQKPEERS